VTLAVSDTGLGIPAACLPRLFHEFYRVRAPEARDTAGTGLGLAICKHIATELGGTITVDSVEGQGSTFHRPAARAGNLAREQQAAEQPQQPEQRTRGAGS